MMKKLAYCTACKRSFNGQESLDQHIQHSPLHSTFTQRLEVVVESEYIAVLESLSASCHSPGKLEENGYTKLCTIYLIVHGNAHSAKVRFSRYLWS